MLIMRVCVCVCVCDHAQLKVILQINKFKREPNISYNPTNYSVSAIEMIAKSCGTFRILRVIETLH